MNEEQELSLRTIIEEILFEFSSVSGGAQGPNIDGYVLPLGMSNRKKKKKRKKIEESKQEYPYQNYFRYPSNEDEYGMRETETYYHSIRMLIGSFANSENPFGESSKNGIDRARKYLQGKLEYPHKT